MKLYATTTSERASKGQGGNVLQIQIQAEQDNGQRPVIANLNAYYSKERNDYLLTFVPLAVQEIEGEIKAIAKRTKTRRWVFSAGCDSRGNYNDMTGKSNKEIIKAYREF